MNKKFNKKKLLTFGIVSLFALALVSAGLVTYLSKPVTADIEVTSPMLQEVYDGSTWKQGTISLDNVFGGESQTFYTKTTNQANVEITGTSENIVTNLKGVTCADFDSVIATTNGEGPYDLIALSLCSEGVDDNHVVFSYGPTPIVWTAGQIDKTTIVVNFNQYAEGTYEFTSQII